MEWDREEKVTYTTKANANATAEIYIFLWSGQLSGLSGSEADIMWPADIPVASFPNSCFRVVECSVESIALLASKKRLEGLDIRDEFVVQKIENEFVLLKAM